jgi:hypothetical protein
MKNCTRCGVVKALTEFHKDKYTKDLLYPQCKSCVKTKQAAWADKRSMQGKKRYISRPDYYRNKHLSSTYGITDGQYKQMLAVQNNRCAICGLTSDKRLVVDHCHHSGRVRGLLCNRCNLGMGHLQDDVQVLESAIKYLKRA